MEFCLIYLPAVFGTSFLNFRIIKNLLVNPQMTQQGTEAARRMTKAFSALCFSWVLTSLPYKIFTLVRQLPLGLENENFNYLGSQYVASNKVLYLEMTDTSFYFIYMAYSFINSIILIVLISNFRKPFEPLVRLLKNKSFCCNGSECDKNKNA